MEEQEFDFSTAAVPEAPVNEWLRDPGYYKGKVVKTELFKPEGKTPNLRVTFETTKGKFSDTFWISPNGMYKLKLLYGAIWGEEFNKTLKGVQSVADYFTAAFNKDKNLNLKVIVEETNGKAYAKLAFPEFIVPEKDFVEKVITPADADYNDFHSVRAPYTPPTGETIITPPVQIKNDVDSDLPF